MATYAYKCLACGQAFEIEATINEKEEAKSEKFACPKCRSKNIQRQFSAIGFIKNVFRSDKKACGCSGDGKTSRGQSRPEGKEDDNGGGHGQSCC